MKKIYVLLLVTALLINSTGCRTTQNESVKEEHVTSESISFMLASNASPEEVTNLPEELYYNKPFDGSKSTGAYFDTLRHDFTIEETTTYKINISVENGTLEMDIYDRKMNVTTVDLEKLTSTSAPNTLETEIVLEPGRYTVVLSAEKFQGMYHILKIAH